MNIALIGYGKMGKEIETLAKTNQHHIVCKIDIDNHNEIHSLQSNHVDVAFEFTTPSSAVENINACFKQHIPVVCGTTGWYDHFQEISDLCKQTNGSLFYAPNFSIGVNIFMAISSYASEIMNSFLDNYSVRIEETHHTQKKDSPSGTAITLANEVMNKIKSLTLWKNFLNETPHSELQPELPVFSFRKDNIVGNHKLIFDSTSDTVTIEHNAKNRQGFALGALAAAQFIISRKGIYTMHDLMKF